LLFFASFSKIEKSAKNGRKCKGYILTFWLFFASFSKIEKSAKNGRKLRL
jgi:hypothetical protein